MEQGREKSEHAGGQVAASPFWETTADFRQVCLADRCHQPSRAYQFCPHQLQTLAAACGYELENYHHTLADAEACAHIALKIL